MEIVSNEAVIALNQDAWGSPAIRMWNRPWQGDASGGALSLWSLVLSTWPCAPPPAREGPADRESVSTARARLRS